MKRWTKNTLITASVLLVSGTVLCGIGFAAGARSIEYHNGKLTVGEKPMEFSVNWTWDSNQINRDISSKMDELNQKIQKQVEDITEQATQEALKSQGKYSGKNVPEPETVTLKEKQSADLTGKSIHSVKTDTGRVNLFIRSGDRWDLSYQLYFPEKFTFSVESGVLELKYDPPYETTLSQYVGGDENIWLTVPKDIVLKEFRLEGSSGNNEITSVSCGSMELNLSAGDTILNNITADSLDLGASAGELSITNSTVGTFDLDASAGNIHTSGLTVKKDCELDFSSGDAVMQASFGGNVSIESSAGDVDLTILGADKDQFNYDIYPSQGRIVVDGVCDLKRNDDDFYQDNKKDQTIEIDGSIGGVQIRFDK